MLSILRRDSRILLQPQCLQVPQVVVELVVLKELQGLALTFQGEVGFDQPRLLFLQHNKFDYYLRNLQALGLK